MVKYFNKVAALKAVKADDIEKIEENVNCLNIEGDARDIDEAIAVLRYFLF